MPVDLWKEVYLQPNPEPQHLELFLKMFLSGPSQTLLEASRKTRYEAIPDAIFAYRDPIPLIAVASLYHPESGVQTERRLKIIVVEPLPAVLEELVHSIAEVVDAVVSRVELQIGYGKLHVSESVRRALRVIRGLSPSTLDVTDAPGPLVLAAHRAGIRAYTFVKRKGYEVLIEKFNV